MFLADVIEFWNLENTGYYSTHKNFKWDFPKMEFFEISKSTSSYSFWDKCLKRGSCVLGTKTKFLIEPILDLGLRSENIEFWKFQICIFGQF